MGQVDFGGKFVDGAVDQGIGGGSRGAAIEARQRCALLRAADLRLLAGVLGVVAAADGARFGGGARQHGQRHAPRGLVAHPALRLRLLLPALRSGHESAHRPDPGVLRDVPRVLDRSGAERPRPPRAVALPSPLARAPVLASGGDGRDHEHRRALQGLAGENPRHDLPEERRASGAPPALGALVQRGRGCSDEGLRGPRAVGRERLERLGPDAVVDGLRRGAPRARREQAAFEGRARDPQWRPARGLSPRALAHLRRRRHLPLHGLRSHVVPPRRGQAPR
mmetsp:Transcript_93439/g.183226  ORF Transcript_93439/g.183226 Transcript_93439/m.183226 type:complete len:280 (-) Transcript_93439:143-982(-)